MSNIRNVYVLACEQMEYDMAITPIINMIKEVHMLDETRREWCSRHLNNQRFLTAIDKKLPQIATEAGVGYRWMINVKNQARLQMDSDKIDLLHHHLQNLKEDIG